MNSGLCSLVTIVLFGVIRRKIVTHFFNNEAALILPAPLRVDPCSFECKMCTHYYDFLQVVL